VSQLACLRGYTDSRPNGLLYRSHGARRTSCSAHVEHDAHPLGVAAGGISRKASRLAKSAHRRRRIRPTTRSSAIRSTQPATADASTSIVGGDNAAHWRHSFCRRQSQCSGHSPVVVLCKHLGESGQLGLLLGGGGISPADAVGAEQKPYPSREDKIALIQQTGLSNRQIANWYERVFCEHGCNADRADSGDQVFKRSPTHLDAPVARLDGDGRAGTRPDKHVWDRWPSSR
jgi:hypothetical protein